MAEVTTARRAGTDVAYAFKAFKRLTGIEFTRETLRSLDAALNEFGEEEAAAATRRWRDDYASFSGGDAAELTIAYYESARRKFKPLYEITFPAGDGQFWTYRFHGAAALLRWWDRQRRLRPKALEVLFATSAARLQIHFQEAVLADRSFFWAAAQDAVVLERLVGAAERALSRASKPARGPTWFWNLVLTGIPSLLLAAGIVVGSNGLPRHISLGAGVVTDAAAMSFLFYLYRAAFPAVSFNLHPKGKGAAVPFHRRALAALYYLSVLASSLVGAALLWDVFF